MGGMKEVVKCAINDRYGKGDTMEPILTEPRPDELEALVNDQGRRAARKTLNEVFVYYPIIARESKPYLEPQASPLDVNWNCPKCGNVNRFSIWHCWHCGEPRGKL